VLVLDDSETVLRVGDVVVQRGTNHRWENRSQATARMAFILVDGAFTAELIANLGEDVLGGLLHDPMQPSSGGATPRTPRGMSDGKANVSDMPSPAASAGKD
jgi:hypothetical protein